MPKVKVPRKSTAVDMTAMCDVSFLLLTFFILTAKFKPDELVAVNIPGARSQKQFTDAITILLSKEGKAYIELGEGKTRGLMLDQMIEKYGDKYPNLKTLTDNQKRYFSKIETWGTPIGDMNRVLSMNGTELQQYQKNMQGIPIDSTNNQIADWVQAARYATGGDIKIAIKSDKDTNIEPVKQVVKGLTARDIHRFLLVTSLAGAAPAAEAADAKDEKK
jgi:biopolymer transport protein ExbD